MKEIMCKCTYVLKIYLGSAQRITPKVIFLIIQLSIKFKKKDVPRFAFNLLLSPFSGVQNEIIEICNLLKFAMAICLFKDISNDCLYAPFYTGNVLGTYNILYILINCNII